MGGRGFESAARSAARAARIVATFEEATTDPAAFGRQRVCRMSFGATTAARSTTTLQATTPPGIGVRARALRCTHGRIKKEINPIAPRFARAYLSPLRVASFAAWALRDSTGEDARHRPSGRLLHWRLLLCRCRPRADDGEIKPYPRPGRAPPRGVRRAVVASDRGATHADPRKDARLI